jgi:hypothetical protein
MYLFINTQSGFLDWSTVKILYQLYDIFVHFFARPKKRTRKRAPVAFGPSDFFALLKAAGKFKIRFAPAPIRHIQYDEVERLQRVLLHQTLNRRRSRQTVKFSFAAASAVLNKCQWEKPESQPFKNVKAGTLILLYFQVHRKDTA